jgi:serine/threonine protein kinase
MAELTPGTTFGRFRIVREVGRGGMGVVYEARQEGLDRRVAIKVLSVPADREFRQRFGRESRAAASIEHPNVVPIYDAGEQDGSLFIAMRFVDGLHLGELVAQHRQLEPERVARIVSQVADGLDAVHSAGLIHRDIKPANILIANVGAGERAFITDFGIAKDAAATTAYTQSGVLMGTIDYVAPEQIEGDRVDARTDVYALGCVVYYALTGKVPFPKAGVPAKMQSHLKDPPPRPSTVRRDLPRSVDAVIERAMAKAPDDRFQSAGDFGRAVVSALTGTALTVRERIVATGEAAPDLPTLPRESAFRTDPTGRLPEPTRRSHRGRWALGLTAVALLAGAAIAVAIVNSSHSAGADHNAKQVAHHQSGAAKSGSGEVATTTSAPRTSYSSQSQALYTVDIPSGWTQEKDDQQIGDRLESIWRDPSDSNTAILIDAMTPASGQTPIGNAASVRADTSKTPGYQEVSFGPATVGPWDAAKWVFEVSGDERVDYFLGRCNTDVALLGSTSPGTFSTWSPVFRHAVGSVRANCASASDASPSSAIPTTSVRRSCLARGAAEGGSALPFVAKGLGCADGERVVVDAIGECRAFYQSAGSASTGGCAVLRFTCELATPGKPMPGSEVVCTRGSSFVSFSLPG